MSKTKNIWVYHPEHAPKVIKTSKYEAEKENGWLDSPASFTKLDYFGIDNDKILAGDEEEKAKAQDVKDAVEGVAKSLNDSLNIKSMKKQEIIDYALEHFNTELDESLKVDELRKLARALSK